MDEFFLSGSFANQGVDGTLAAVLKFAKHVASRIQFLKLAATSSDVDAYILFESLNDRGQPLDPADLLRMDYSNSVMVLKMKKIKFY